MNPRPFFAMNIVLNFFILLTTRILNLFWVFFCASVNSAASCFAQGRPPSKLRPRTRKLPLYTCAISILTTTHRIYVKSQQFNGPVGSKLQKLCAFAALQSEPYTRGIKHRCLSLLTRVDDHILAYETAMEENLHPLKHVFDKIDDLVQIAETVPVKVDAFANKLSAFVIRVPFLPTVLVSVLSWLEFWVSVLLAFWELEEQMREKDIPVDIYCGDSSSISEYAEESSLIEYPDNGREIHTPREICPAAESPPRPIDKGILYMEVPVESVDKPLEGDETNKANEIIITRDENGGSGNGNGNDDGSDSDDDNDPILDLFESGWLMNPARKNRREDTMLRAASYG